MGEEVRSRLSSFGQIKGWVRVHLKRHWVLYIILVAFIVGVAYLMVSSPFVYWKPVTWLTAGTLLLLIFYTYFTFRIAQTTATDLEMRTRPVVTLEVKNCGKIQCKQAGLAPPLTIRIKTHTSNLSRVNGYAWIRFEFFKGQLQRSSGKWEATLLGSSPKWNDYSGEQQLDIPARYRLEGHTSLSHARLISELIACATTDDNRDVFLVVKIKTSPVEHLRAKDPVSRTAYRLKLKRSPERFGIVLVREQGAGTKLQANHFCIVEMIPFQTSYPFKSDWDDSHRSGS
jgi:hypothetical protein